ncbi:MAG TPA: response regulator [Povalibacter sp.]|nr:response regulator [Povalibacter sp.]
MARTYRIQIVEDQYFVALDFEQALTAAGFECTDLASSGEQAVELAARDRPDLVLMDIQLNGDPDGVDTARRILQGCGARCIFCSAHIDSETRKRAESVRPLAYLEKPFSSGQLVEVVRRVTSSL